MQLAIKKWMEHMTFFATMFGKVSISPNILISQGNFGGEGGEGVQMEFREHVKEGSCQ